MSVEIWTAVPAAGIWDAKGSCRFSMVRLDSLADLNPLIYYHSAPGAKTTEFDGTDPGMKKLHEQGQYGFFNSAARDSVVMDSVTEVSRPSLLPLF